MIKKGSKSIASIMKGNKVIQYIYKGTMLVYQAIKNFFASGVFPLTLTNTVGSNLTNYKIEGNSAQDGTPTLDNPIDIESVGDKTKNLFDNDTPNLTLHKVNLRTATIFTDINLILNPNTYKLTLFTSNAIDLKYGLKYSILVTQNGENKEIYLESSSVSTNGVFTIDQVTIVRGVYMFLSSSDNDTAQITIDKIQLEEGSTATEFEHYGYKIPVKVSGNNLYGNNETSTKTKENDYTVSIEINKSVVNITGVSNMDYGFGLTKTKDILPAGTYTVSVKSLNYGDRLYLADENGNVLVNYITNTSPKQFTVEKPLVIIIYGVFMKDSTYNNTDIEIQIEKGTTVTNYEPYIEPVTTNIYLDEPLRKIGDYADYIEFKSQKLVRYVEVVDGTLKSLDTPIEETIDLPSIPTVEGTTILDSDVTLQPSYVEVEYTNEKPQAGTTLTLADGNILLDSNGDYFNVKEE